MSLKNSSAVTVGSVFSEEQARSSVERVADQLQQHKNVRVSPLTVDNIVSTFSVGVPAGLDLAVVAIALNGRLGEWKPKTQNDRGTPNDYLRGVVGTDQPFQSCVSRCKETNTTNSIFRSSQVVVGGAKSVGIALYSAHLVALKLYKSLGLHTGVYHFQVQNVVTSFGLGYRLNLRYFEHHHHLSCEWDEAEFRGLSWRFEGAVFVIFDTGNAVLTGGKSFEALNAVYQKALPILERYKVGAEKMYIEPSKLRVKGKKDPEKHSATKTRKERLQAQTYKRIEADYLDKIRASNEAEYRLRHPKAAEQKAPPAKRKRYQYNQVPGLSVEDSSSEVLPTNSHIAHNHTAPVIVQRQWKKQIALTAVAPFQAKYLDRQAPPTLMLRKAMSRGSQLDEAKDQVKREQMKMENPPVHVLGSVYRQ